MESTDAMNAEAIHPDAEKQQVAPQQWDLPTSRGNLDDPLLQALIVMTKLNHRPFSAEALTAGLPLDKDSILTPELFVRAASRAGLSAKCLKKTIESFSEKLLPAVLLLKDQRACVCVKLEDTQATVIYPETGAGQETIAIEELAEHYTGFCILTKPSYEFSKKTEGLHAEQQKRWLWDTLQKAWPIMSEVIVASFLINLFALATPLFVMNVYDRVVPNNAVETLWALAVGVLIVFIFDFFMRNVRTYFIDNAGKKIDLELSAKIYEHLLGLKMDTRPPSVGALSNTVNAFDSFREFITSATISVLVDIPFALLFVAVIYFIGGPIAFVPLIAIPIIIGASLILQVPFNRLIQTSHRHAAEKQAALIESLTNVETIKTNNAESALQRRWENLTEEASKANVKLRLLSGTTLSFSQFAQHFATIALVIYGVYLIGENLLSMGALIACTILTGRALAPMAQVASLITRFHQSMASLESLDVIMKAPVDRKAGATPIHREHFKGAVECRHLNFTYPGTQDKALKDISFKIKPGEKVGLVGRIGSGKTTLEKLLVGLYSPTDGDIFIDDVKITQLDPADLRSQIGYIPQDIELFYGSVRDNITLGAPYVDDADVIRAAHIAGVDQFVDNHADGYDRQVGERGMQLSGGQRQAIIVARAILMDPPIIIMDEPTNLMDDKTESVLRQRLENYLENKTVILITHRASMLALVQRLIVVDKGQLVADGSKDYVLNALSDGRVKTSIN